MLGLDHFGLIASFYDRIFAEPDPTRLRQLLALPAGRLLDVGGGTGRVSEMLSGEASLVVVTDSSRAMLAEAQGKRKLRSARGHAEELPFARGSFDRVLVVDAFHHFAHHRLAAAELMRVVAPGGRLVIEELNYERLPVKAVAWGEKMLLMGSHFYRPQALRYLFEGHGRVTLHTDDPINMWVVVEKT